MARPRLLDLFCGAGGCAAGYVRAGFEVWGVDHKPQPNYLASGASEFILADTLMYLRCLLETRHTGDGNPCGTLLDGVDAIHASPPCQAFSAMNRAVRADHPNLVGPVRTLLEAAGKPYVIENVEGAPLLRPCLVLCGTMFGLRVRRHRVFEVRPFPGVLLPDCTCRNGTITGRLVPHRRGGRVAPGRTRPPPATEAMRRDAIGVPWMSGREARQAVPPAYTEFLGRQLLAALG